jgi:RimJ/RimL family protein N-acetyltransferase
MLPFPLANEHVRLTVPVAADVDRITAACQDPEVQRWTVVPSPYTRSDAETFVNDVVPAGWESETSFTWALRDAASDPDAPDGPLLGMIGMTAQGAAGTERIGEVGFWTAPEARRRGLTTEAARLVVDWALDPEGLGLVRAQWIGYVGNWASLAVARKVGFRYEGLLRRFSDRRGERRDSWVASLLPDDAREATDGPEWPAP